MPIVAKVCPLCLQPTEQNSEYPNLLLNPKRDRIKHPRALHICPMTHRANADQWDKIKSVRSPVAGKLAQNSYGYWFNYFWEEAVTAPGLTATDKSRLTDSFFAVFEAKTGGGWKERADFTTTDNYGKLKVLRNLLHIGFIRVPYQPTRLSYGDGHVEEVHGVKYQSNKATDGRTLFLEAINGDQGQEVMRIGYRGDSRDYKTLMDHKGFRARSRSEGAAQAYGLNKPWHPYSIPLYRDSIFLRRGKSQDNCLHTAVSVGTHFKKLVHFPIFTDATLFKLPVGPISSWTGPEARTLATEYGARVGKDQLGDYLEHDTQIYVVRVDENVEGFNTEAWQTKEPFPERSVKEIPLDQILAFIVVTRKYWWDTHSGDKAAHAWQFFDIICRDAVLLPDEGKFRGRFSDSTATFLKKHLEARCKEAKGREDIAGDRAARTQFIQNPHAAPKVDAGVSAETIFAAKCDICGKGFASTVKARMHQASCKG